MSSNETMPVRAAHRFDLAPLADFLCTQQLLQRGQSLDVTQFNAGQSNPTFLLKTPDRRLVLRKKPPGKLLPKAHAIDREYRLLQVLHRIGFPVPEPLAYCTDAALIGTEFYLMAFVEGRIFRDPALPQLPPEERAAIYRSMNATLAQLHAVDWRAAGLGDMARSGSYSQRQLAIWNKQYRLGCKIADSIPEMDEMSKLLPSVVPGGEQLVICHGDFRLENMILHPTEPRVVAVLDWELTSIGDARADLAYNCLPYHIPSMARPDGGNAGFAGDLPEGIPSEEEYTRHYARARNLAHPIPHFSFFLALSFFRLASIAHGVYARSLQGNASSTNASIYGAVASALASMGLEIGTVYAAEHGRGLSAVSANGRSSRGPADDIATSPSLLSGRGIYIAPPSDRAKDILFMEQEVMPAERVWLAQHDAFGPSNRWQVPPVMEELKRKAKAQGLWNLFLPSESKLTQAEYAPIAELTGRSMIAPEVFNCGAPDTGNMEVLHLYGTPAQKARWLTPLLEGEIRSCFCMTEPDVASSDATNMECTIERDGDEYVVTGRKWWSSGAGDPRCKIAIVMGTTSNPDAKRHERHSMILVPMDAPGVRRIRPLQVFGFDDAPHGHWEVEFNAVRVPASNMLLGEGRGFEIAQGRLGPGRIHHCMRLIGMAERALENLCERAVSRVAFGKHLARQGTVLADIAKSRVEIDQARLLVLTAAHLVDTIGGRAARHAVGAAKIAAPAMALRVVDRAIQVHGGAGVCQDFFLAHAYAGARSLRIADGPDEVHMMAMALHELRPYVQKAKL